MKIIYSKKFNVVYASDPASAAGRMEAIYNEIKDLYEFIEPTPASVEDLKLAHSDMHITHIKSLGLVYDVALLAVGGAIKSAEIALYGEPAFGLIRPPGHHAGRDGSWGFCYFNNIAIAVLKNIKTNVIKSALIIDIDLHYGDGTENILYNINGVEYYHLPHDNRINQVEELKEFLLRKKKENYDVIAVSAGFDRHVEDWGGTLTTNDYAEIAKIIKEYSESNADGRVFAVLEGGYNHKVLGKNVKAFLKGLEK